MLMSAALQSERVGRLFVALIAVPLVFVASLIALVLLVEQPAPALPAIPGALTFAAIVLTRDTLHAARRASIALIAVGILDMIAALFAPESATLRDGALAAGAILVVGGVGCFLIALRLARVTS